MKLVDSLTQLVGAGSAAKQNQGQNHGGVAFETFFAEADNRQTPQVADSRESRNDRGRDRNTQSSDEGRTRSNRNDGAERRNERRNERVGNETRIADTQYAEETAYAESTAPEVELDENQVAAMIAAILQIPVETVIEILAELDMVVEDLLEPQNVTKFLQVALDAESPAQLLTDEQFPELFKAITEEMAELLQEVEAQVTIVASNDSARAANTTLLSELSETEGLQVLVDDGEVIVTDQAMSEEFVNEENASNNQPSSQTQATATQAETSNASQEIPSILPPEVADILPDQPQISQVMTNLNVAKAKVEAAIQQTQPQADVNAADVIDQIMNQVKITSNGANFNEMRMTLSPDSLGDIVLRVITQNGIVTAMFEAESQRVKETLEASFNQLRDALEEQGLQFSELSVSVRQEGNERMNQFEYARQAARRRINALNTAEDVETETPQIKRHNGVIDVQA